MSDFHVSVGEQVTFSKTVGESDIYMFAGITGDFSGNHVDEQYMTKSAFGHRIAHGALLVGFMSTTSTMMIARPSAEITSPKPEKLATGIAHPTALIWIAVPPTRWSELLASARRNAPTHSSPNALTTTIAVLAVVTPILTPIATPPVAIMSLLHSLVLPRPSPVLRLF